MAELREVIALLGFEDVATYLQSGNAVFDAADDAADFKPRLEAAISDRFGMLVGVVVLSAPEMEQVIRACPYPGAAEEDPTKVHVTFIDPPLDDGFQVEVDQEPFLLDEFQSAAGVVYMHLPDGMGRSKLPAALGKALKDKLVTTRNWRTVKALAEMLTG